jgi:hypothetical protein
MLALFGPEKACFSVFDDYSIICLLLFGILLSLHVICMQTQSIFLKNYT